MSFDRSPQRQQEPSDLPSSASPSHNDHRLPPASSFGLRPISGPAPTAAPLTTPTTTAAPVKMEERDGPSPTGAGGSHYGGPSLPPPSAMHPHQRDQHQSHYQHQQHQQHQQHHYAEYKSEYKSEYSRPPPTTTASTSSSLPFASSSTSAAPIWDYSDRSAYSSADQQPIAQYQARDYPRAHNLPSLPADISPSPYARQPTTSAFDPIRSSQVAEPSTQTVIRPKPEPVLIKSEPVPIAPQQPSSQLQQPQQPQQSGAIYADRPQSTASPIMSISQLLSSDTPPTNAPPPSSRLRYAETIDHPPPQHQPPSHQHQPAHIAPAPAPAPAPTSVSASALESEVAAAPPASAPPPSQPFRNGIHNLLNDDDRTDDVYEMADSESDTEDASRFASASQSQAQTAVPLPAAPQTFLPTVTELNGHSPPQKGPYEASSDYYPSLPEQNGYDLSDDSSVEENGDSHRKPLVRRTLDDLELSSDDEDIFTTHRDQMVQYMIHVYRRRQQVIDDYEEKRMHRHALMNDQLQRIYEKRYGTEFTQSNQEPYSATTSMLLQAAKEEKERSKRKQKRAKQRQRNQGYVEEDDDTAADLQSQKTSKAPRKVEEERRQIWLNIARKDVPRMARIISRVQATRAGNCKKVAQYCQKEVKRAATNGGRLTRDVQLKAKKASKEMLVFWKKNEKEERELRKKAEKEALERLRLEEERRESQRQARKLNFLITQTELYSHFIGRKIKQGEGDDDEEAAMAEPSPAGQDEPEEADIDLEADGDEKHLGEIDFDEDDDEKLREQARRGAQNALAKQRERTRVFDEGARERRAAAESSDISMNAAQLDTMNFQDPSSMGTEEIKQPTMLMCQLKSYQLKGLNWLANLYEQGINGILADEMGLGKTVQSISLMAYLAEVHNIWGPFLVIAPSSTLHNWQQEISKFVPSFRALPYWGNPKDRKVLRQFWNRKQLYGRDAPFHVVITSYQLVLTDVSYFQRVKWQYMVLDEAQAIKSSSSARWKQLLGFHCRNRLLLTGTPIQNSMQELWALLHFIMPTLFDSHEEFSEWFSKDIESHAENKGTLNEHQLRRLHMILKPFMLRRIKRNVQHELGEKIEVEVFCDLTARQRALYRGLKEKISVSELLEKATSLGDTESMDSLMNLVMQFRKVCNHPELFERADVESPLSFCTSSETGSLSKETSLYCPYSSRSHIKYRIPKHLYRNGGILNVPGPHSNAGFTTHYLDNLMNIWSTHYIKDSMYEEHAFSFLRFADMSPQEASTLAKRPLIARWVSHLAQRDQRTRRRFFEDKAYAGAPVHTYASMLVKESMPVPTPGSALEELMTVGERAIHLDARIDKIYIPAAEAVPVDVFCADRSFESDQTEQLFDADVRACLFGRPQCATEPKEASDLKQIVRKADGRGLMPIPRSGQGYSHLRVPAMRDLILDSGKLATLDRLLEKLKTEGHRCLIYFQMTRMIDLMEEYIAYKQYKYLRLDGSSKISDRRDMVSDWQTRPEIFIFLLSTRAGGLGINLTAADTVIFYDSDWNPTVDQQAMDRAHRLGQTKQVTVYRLITKGTIEERILQRAKQKDEIQKVVISGGEFKQVDFKPREIVSLLLDDEEMDNKLQQQLKRKADEEEKKKARPAKRSKKNNQETVDMDKLMSAGGDVLPEDVENGGSSSSAAKRKARIGRPRTNISFTG